MPIGAVGAYIAIAGAAGTAGAGIYAAKKQSSTAKYAADLTTTSANHAADLQAQANAQALAYQKEQDARLAAATEAAQHSNYDMWAADAQNNYNLGEAGAENSYAQFVANLKNQRSNDLATGHNVYSTYRDRQERIGQLGELLGMPKRTITPYEDPAPLIIPDFTKPQFTIPSYQGNAGDLTGGSGVDPKAAAFIQNWQATHAPTEGIAPLAAALQQNGFGNVSRYMYGQTPSNNELNVGGVKYKVIGAENGPSPYWYKPGMRDN